MGCKAKQELLIITELVINIVYCLMTHIRCFSLDNYLVNKPYIYRVKALLGKTKVLFAKEGLWQI